MSGRRSRSAARLARGAATLAGASALLLLAASGPAAAGTPTRGKVASLRGQSTALDSRAHRAVLELYALDTRFRQAAGRLAALEDQAGRLRSRQALLAQQLSATQHSLVSSQRHLGANLRSLYQEGDTDALAVMLGAQSLDDAVTRIDDLTRFADESRKVVAATSAARTRLVRLRSTLAAQRAQLGSALASARQTANALAAARAERVAFIGRLRSEQQLKAQEIAALQVTALQAEKKSQLLQATAPTTPTTPAAPNASPIPSLPDPTPAAPAAGGRTLTVSATGYILPGRTATGLPVGWGIVAVDPSVIPLGTRLTIPGYGEGVAADTGGAVRGATIDLWFPTLAQAHAWGRRTVTITLH